MQLTAAVPALLISSPAAKSHMWTRARARKQERRKSCEQREARRPLGRGLSDCETKERGSPGPGPPGHASATPAGSARGDARRGKTCSRPPTSPGSLFPEPTIQASACRQLGRRQPPQPQSRGPGLPRAAGAGHPGPTVRRGKEAPPSGRSSSWALKAWLMRFLVLTNSSGQSDVSLMVTLLCFLAVNEIIRNDLSSTNIRS